jgi:hypothetical protein
MTKLNLLAAAGGALALVLIAKTGVGAAPLSQGADATIKAAATLTMVEQTHGIHRTCRLGWVSRWGVARWHRHVGVTNVPVRC